MPDFTIRATTAEDRDWIEAYITENWGASFVVAHGVVYYPHELPGYVAGLEGGRAGLATYHIEGEACEIVTLDSQKPGIGIGTALIEAVKEAALESGCKRLWVITTNDNLHALGFYQKRGFELVRINRNAIEASRRIKPSISRYGMDGIPIRDEIELEMRINVNLSRHLPSVR
jgi:ribosomal protein S18 acetylase RimI-like enzyme